MNGLPGNVEGPLRLLFLVVLHHVHLFDLNKPLEDWQKAFTGRRVQREIPGFVERSDDLGEERKRDVSACNLKRPKGLIRLHRRRSRPAA